MASSSNDPTKHPNPKPPKDLHPQVLTIALERDIVLAVNEAASNAIEHACIARPADLVTQRALAPVQYLALTVRAYHRLRSRYRHGRPSGS
jgi:hypothetical protein